MRILILGATGRTGKLILEAALSKDHLVNVLVRNSKRISPHPNLQVFEGDVTHSKDLELAIEGCSHVISCLNISRKSDFPWSALRTPATLLSDTMNALIPIAQSHRIKKIVLCSAWGVLETRKEIPAWFRWFIDNSNIGPAYKDHERQERLLSNSGLAHLIVRPVGLSNGKLSAVRESFSNVPKPSLLISRKSLAYYMLEKLLIETNYSTVVISKA